jgi:hypothetical protein
MPADRDAPAPTINANGLFSVSGSRSRHSDVKMSRKPSSLILLAAMSDSSVRSAYPRPMKGILVAITVRNCTLASGGRPAMYNTASTTAARFMRGSGRVSPSA